nr:STAS domain-containing protein [Streptacidiphilus sp. PB12-B1b]
MAAAEVSRGVREVREVRVDFTGVPFMDTSGLAFVTDLRQRCREAGALLRIGGLRPQPRRVFAVAGFPLPELPAVE